MVVFHLVKRHAAKHSRTEDRRELCSGRYDLGKAFLDVEPERPATILGFDSISIRCHLTRLLGINHVIASDEDEGVPERLSNLDVLMAIKQELAV